MNFTPEVIAALETLRKNAVNDFELHRISVLEKDLIAPPVVEVIDNTHQKFDGKIFNIDKSGHFNKNLSLHRFVFDYYNGEIPAGNFEIHHRDFNKANNSHENLQILTREEHQRLHALQRLSKSPIEKNCPICGKKFMTGDIRQKYCSRTCANVQTDRTRKLKLSKNKKCPVCGKLFNPKSHNTKQICCSISCAKKKQWNDGVFKTRKNFHN